MEKNFYKSFKPLLSTSQLMGLTPVSDLNNEIYLSKLSYAGNFLAVATYLPLTVAVVYYANFSKDAYILKTTNLIKIIVSSIFILVVWCNSIIQRKILIPLFKDMLTIDGILHKNGLPVNYTKFRQNFYVQLLVRSVLIIIAVLGQMLTGETLDASMDIGNTIMFVAIFYFPIIMNSALCHLVTGLIASLKHRFKLINKGLFLLIKFRQNEISLIKHSDGFRGTPLDLLNQLCLLHHELVKVIDSVNNFVGVPLLIMFGVSFVNIVLGLYFFCNELQSPAVSWKKLINSLLLSSTYIADTFYVCYMCHTTVEEGARSGILIHKIDTNDYDMKDEIEMFSLQIANADMNFNAAGFFPVNYTLLFSIIGGVTTYIIILIQLASNKN